MKPIFEFPDSCTFVNAAIKELPKEGYGQISKLAKHLRVHTTLVSQILLGKKTFTPEQAVSVGEFLGLSEIEGDYLVALVEFERAGSAPLKNLLRRRLAAIAAQSTDLSKRIRHESALSEKVSALFYSDWSYSAIRQLPSIRGLNSPDALAKFLNLPKARVQEIIEFLLRENLLVAEGKSLKTGPRSTHLPNKSPWIKSHHANWRQKALEAMSQRKRTDFFYSGPMTLSADDAAQIQSVLHQALERSASIVGNSPSEVFRCLNVDWFEVVHGDE